MTTSSAGTVYIETSIVSYLTARAPRELLAAAWQAATVDWWDDHRSRYQLFTSELTLDEAAQGDKEASTRRLNALQDVPLLPITDAVERLTNALIMERAVPTGSRIDAAHVAVSAIYGIDYLLTWNFRHMANAGIRPLIRALCETHGYSSPEICTPFELMGLIGDIKDG